MRRDAVVPDLTIGEVWRNDEPARPSDLHTDQALIPAANDLIRAEREGEWGDANRGIEQQSFQIAL